MGNDNKIVSVSVSISIIVGLAIYELLSKAGLALLQHFAITFLASTAFYEILFRVFVYLFSNVLFLKKVIWGNLFLDGYWLYTYEIKGEKKYGAWCIKQDYNTTEVKGFGIAKDGTRRSDVQSVSQLLKRGNDYEIVNMRRDVIEGAFGDNFNYSKTTLHLHSRKTFCNLFNYPTTITGVTIVYGGELSGNRHGKLIFTKSETAESENDIEEEVKRMIKRDTQ